MTGLPDELNLTVPGCFQQLSFHFAIVPVVFSVQDEGRACKGPQHSAKVVDSQFTVDLWHRFPEKSGVELRSYQLLRKHAPQRFFLYASEPAFREKGRYKETYDLSQQFFISLS